MYNNNKIIGLCITQINEERHFEFVLALNNAINLYGYKLFIYNSFSEFYWNAQKKKSDKSVFELIDYRIIDILILFEESFKNDSISSDIEKNAKKYNVPIITIGKFEGLSNNISLNYGSGFELIVRHIIEEHNIKDTIMIAGARDNYYSTERIGIYKKVLAENNLPFYDSMVAYGEFWSEPTQKIVQNLIDNNKLPRAIICANDMMAVAASSVLHENGYAVPQDVIVTGFDGTEDAKHNNPPITTCKTDYNKLSQDIVLYINKILQGEEIDEMTQGEQILKIYTSCGCNKKPRSIKDASLHQVLRDRYNRVLAYNSALYEMTENIFACKSPKEVINELNEFGFFDTYIFVNNNILNESLNPAHEEQDKNFDDMMYLLYQTDSDIDEYPIIYNREQIFPDINKVLNNDNPLVFISLSSIGKPIGFLCVNFKADIENYSNIPQYTTSLSNALSGYRNIRYLDYISKYFERLSEIDTMTGLLNREGFYRGISDFRNKMDKDPSLKLIIAIADIDGLKKINDNYGHLAGDRAIVSVAKIINSIFIDNIFCVRYGGDEFLICALVKDKKYGEKLIKNHIFRHLNSLNMTSDELFEIAVSIGFSSSESSELDLNTLLSKSDELMYNHKLKKKKKV